MDTNQILSLILETTDIPEVYFKFALLNKIINRKAKECVDRKKKQFLKKQISPTKIKEWFDVYFVNPNGKIEGLNQRYYQEHLIRETNYSNGKMSGLCVGYVNIEGKRLISCKCNYVDDKLDGLYQEWYCDIENGIKVECEYKDGWRNGIATFYYTTGLIFDKCNYKNGQKDGLYQRWDNSGALREECNYVNGKLIV